jgi:quercetin dioxygenase-like cupin family protein
MGQKAGKVWGTTEQILMNGALEFHRIDARAGTKCSKHLHKYKFNSFYVVSGTLIIRVWKNDYDLIDETILNAGDFTTVKPGEYHQFECREDCVAFELYYSHFDHNDIERETVGGAVNEPDLYEKATGFLDPKKAVNPFQVPNDFNPLKL